LDKESIVKKPFILLFSSVFTVAFIQPANTVSKSITVAPAGNTLLTGNGMQQSQSAAQGMIAAKNNHRKINEAAAVCSF
jgi:hypothetical protein